MGYVQCATSRGVCGEHATAWADWRVPGEPATQLAAGSLLGKRGFPCFAGSTFSVKIS